MDAEPKDRLDEGIKGKIESSGIGTRETTLRVQYDTIIYSMGDLERGPGSPREGKKSKLITCKPWTQVSLPPKEEA